MFRTSLNPDCGMAFLFKKPNVLSFWGRNTLIPLDIAFVDSDGVISNISHINTNSLKSVSSNKKCLMAIEANLGWFESNGIKPGHKVNLDKLTYESGIVVFDKNIKTAQFGHYMDGLRKRNDPVLSPTNQELESGEDKVIQPNPQNLPVLTEENIGQYLEDALDEEEANKFDPQRLEQPREEAEENIPPVDVPEEPVRPTEDEYPEFTSTEDAIRWAENNDEVVKIYYITDGGRDIIRNVEPHGEFHAKTTGNQILVTFDKNVGDIRAFIVGNIMHHEFVGEKFNRKFVVQP